MVYIRQNQTELYGVIIPTVSANALIRRRFAVEAPRRSFARDTGICLQLTDLGLDFVKDLK